MKAGWLRFSGGSGPREAGWARSTGKMVPREAERLRSKAGWVRFSREVAPREAVRFCSAGKMVPREAEWPRLKAGWVCFSRGLAPREAGWRGSCGGRRNVRVGSGGAGVEERGRDMRPPRRAPHGHLFNAPKAGHVGLGGGQQFISFTGALQELGRECVAERRTDSGRAAFGSGASPGWKAPRQSISGGFLHPPHLLPSKRCRIVAGGSTQCRQAGRRKASGGAHNTSTRFGEPPYWRHCDEQRRTMLASSRALY